MRRGKDIILPSSSELPARLVVQMNSLARGLVALRGTEDLTEDDWLILWRVAESSIPEPRRGCLLHLLTFGDATPNKLKDALGLNLHSVGVALDDLERLGVVSHEVDGPAVVYRLSDWVCGSLRAAVVGVEL